MGSIPIARLLVLKNSGKLFCGNRKPAAKPGLTVLRGAACEKFRGERNLFVGDSHRPLAGAKKQRKAVLRKSKTLVMKLCVEVSNINFQKIKLFC